MKRFNKIASAFTKTMDQLAKLEEKCRSDAAKLQDQIVDLSVKRDDVLDEAYAAKNLASNISKLLGDDNA